MSVNRIAFALSGGGARGAVQVGMLRALRERSIEPDLVVGTSAGAVNGTWYALHPDQLTELERVWLTLTARTVFPGSRLGTAYNWMRHGYAHRVDGWRQILLDHFAGARFEDAAVETAVVTVRLVDGEPVAFDSGPIVPTLLASTAVPGLFPPQPIEGALYVDGGVVEFLPIPTARTRGASTIYALDCSDFHLGRAGGPTAVDRCGQISATAWVRLVMRLADEAGCRIYLLRPPLGDITDGRNFDGTARLIQAGYDYACQELDRQGLSRSA